jgi:tRNA modification GTPase
VEIDVPFFFAMTFDLDDTIAAIATAPGGALRGIIRVSGIRTLAIVKQLIRVADGHSMEAIRQPSCMRGAIGLPRLLGDVPVTLCVWPTSSSYTRQPSAELHLPGSPPLLAAALEVVCHAGARLAREGEFTLRAFLAGRLDLTQAEAVLGVIDANSRRELDHALAQLAGGLAQPLAALRERLLDLLAQLEAGLDFVEEDIEFISREELQAQLAAGAEQVAALEQQMQARGESGRIPRIVLIGLPNVGKSSLFNALAGDDAAIVSEVAGTTRDFVTRRMKLGERECLLTDTAGALSDKEAQAVDAKAQQAAREQAEHADLTIVCLDASRPLTAWEQNELHRAAQMRLLIVTKCDLPGHVLGDTVRGAICTSSVTGAGLPELRTAIAEALDAAPVEAGVVAGTADRCRESLQLAAEALQRAHAAARASAGEELVAAEVRQAVDELGRVVGAVYTDDILDRVFSRFCIGK